MSFFRIFIIPSLVEFKFIFLILIIESFAKRVKTIKKAAEDISPGIFKSNALKSFWPSIQMRL